MERSKNMLLSRGVLGGIGAMLAPVLFVNGVDLDLASGEFSGNIYELGNFAMAAAGLAGGGGLASIIGRFRAVKKLRIF